MSTKKQRSHTLKRKGFTTTNDLMDRLGLPRRTILNDIKRGRLTPYQLPVHQGLKNAPKYFSDENAREYEKLYTPIPV